MKRFKKIMSVLLTAIMVLAMCVPVMADTAKTTININGGTKDGSTYTAYKLLDVTDLGNNKYNYSINNKYSTVLQEATNKTDSKEIINYISGLTASSTPTIQKFADTVYSKIKNAPLTGDNTTQTNKFENIDQGYYLIAETAVGSTEDTYSLVMLNTAGNAVCNIATKEDKPTLEKKIKEKNDSVETNGNNPTGWQDGADYDIGDDVPFQLIGTVSAKYDSYSDYEYKFHDKMSSGLDFNEKSVVVNVINGNKVVYTCVKDTDYTIVRNVSHGENDTCTFEIQFTNLKDISAVNSTSKIVVEYTAKLNSNAVIGQPGNPNEAQLEYDNNPYGGGTGKTPWDKVIAFTYKLVANKVDGSGNALAGAGFTLYKYIADDTTTNDHYLPVGSEITGETTFTFTGLDAGKYKLVESTVPGGYNKAEDLIFEVKATYDTSSTDPTLTGLEIVDANGNRISDGESAVFTTNLAKGSFTTDVVNHSGSELPSTGGIGTTIFYVVGVILMLGAGVLLVTKKRMSSNR